MSSAFLEATQHRTLIDQPPQSGGRARFTVSANTSAALGLLGERFSVLRINPRGHTVTPAAAPQWGPFAFAAAQPHDLRSRWWRSQPVIEIDTRRTTDFILAKSMPVVVIGSGLDTDDSAVNLIRKVLTDHSVTLVIDMDPSARTGAIADISTHGNSSTESKALIELLLAG